VHACGEALQVASRPMNLLYLADPMCSWCYGFGPTLDALLAQPGAAAPLQLALVMGGLRPHTTEVLDSAKARDILGHWQHVNEATALPFHTGPDAALVQPDFVYDTEPASRAVVAVRTHWPRLMWRYFKAVQQAFYAEGRNVTRPEVLADVAQALGIPRADFAAALAADAARNTTLQDFAQAQAWGIRGFPALVAEHAGALHLLAQGHTPLEALHERLHALTTAH
jgi:putative protein-disulfide isomerase